jgi:hypothetical protein
MLEQSGPIRGTRHGKIHDLHNSVKSEPVKMKMGKGHVIDIKVDSRMRDEGIEEVRYRIFIV